MDFGVKIEVERKWAIVGEFVDFSEDVQVREIHLEHGAKGEEQAGDIEGG